MKRSMIMCGMLTVFLGLVSPTAFAQDQAQTGQEANTISLAFRDATIERAVAEIEQKFDVRIEVYGGARGERVSVMADDLTLEQALHRLTAPFGWVSFETDNGYGISDVSWYNERVVPELVERKTYKLNYVNASEIARAVNNLLTPGAGKVTANDRVNKLFVDDLPEIHARVERFIEEVDVPEDRIESSEASRRKLRVFANMVEEAHARARTKTESREQEAAQGQEAENPQTTFSSSPARRQNPEAKKERAERLKAHEERVRAIIERRRQEKAAEAEELLLPLEEAFEQTRVANRGKWQQLDAEARNETYRLEIDHLSESQARQIQRLLSRWVSEENGVHVWEMEKE